MSPYATRQSTRKMTNRPHLIFAHRATPDLHQRNLAQKSRPAPAGTDYPGNFEPSLIREPRMGRWIRGPWICIFGAPHLPQITPKPFKIRVAPPKMQIQRPRIQRPILNPLILGVERKNNPVQCKRGSTREVAMQGQEDSFLEV